MARLVVLLACGALLFATQRPTFRSTSRSVHVYATVQGPDGRLVTNLPRDDFEILDEGRPQTVTVFDNTPQKITVAVMFDMSNSMAGEYPRIHASGHALVEALWPEDRARIGSFGDEVAISPFLSSDKLALRAILDEELWPGGATPLWHAVETAMTALAEEPGRRVVLLLTDGDDSGSLAGSRGRTRDMAERGGYMIYAVGLRGRGMADDMIRLVNDTGGGHFLVRAEDDLGKTFAQVVEELHHQYVIGFASEADDGRLHRITVRTKTPGMKVRGRTSYFAGETGEAR